MIVSCQRGLSKKGGPHLGLYIYIFISIFFYLQHTCLAFPKPTPSGTGPSKAFHQRLCAVGVQLQATKQSPRSLPKRLHRSPCSSVAGAGAKRRGGWWSVLWLFFCFLGENGGGVGRGERFFVIF